MECAMCNPPTEYYWLLNSLLLLSINGLVPTPPYHVAPAHHIGLFVVDKPPEKDKVALEKGTSECGKSSYDSSPSSFPVPDSSFTESFLGAMFRPGLLDCFEPTPAMHEFLAPSVKSAVTLAALSQASNGGASSGNPAVHLNKYEDFLARSLFLNTPELRSSVEMGLAYQEWEEKHADNKRATMEFIDKLSSFAKRTQGDIIDYDI